uniref:Uncharacterized protein n=1 Tax=Knipowitschia caucasica TaxID=637954 RepID=A0AAV2MB48_KNICA
MCLLNTRCPFTPTLALNQKKCVLGSSAERREPGREEHAHMSAHSSSSFQNTAQSYGERRVWPLMKKGESYSEAQWDLSRIIRSRQSRYFPYSEEEGKDSDHSKGTISTNSFYSDDTGCPTSESVSPTITPSGSEQSTNSSPVLAGRTAKVKRVRVVVEGGGEPHPRTRQKREVRSAMKHKGSELDFSSWSSSGSGSLKASQTISNSVGKKTPTHSRTIRIRPLPIFKPAGNTVENHDAELYAPYRTPPRVSSSNSSCNSSPSARRTTPSYYHSCGDNHGIRPPYPEQYLTPLQQKEVAIRHLKTKLQESETRVRDRESEIEELKGQLSRMREDWIEEECHRVEAQLSLKEARKEIKQLRQVVETMKSSLMEKDKGIQKYFIDINIQNRKLESLLHNMELAQSGNGSLDNEQTLDFICEGGKKLLSEGDVEMEHGAEAMADSGLLVNDEMANREDILEQKAYKKSQLSVHKRQT